MIDTHCHILYGVDDASKTATQSLDMLRLAQTDGIKIICATSHLKPGMYENDSKSLSKACEQVDLLIKENQLDIKIVKAAENYLSYYTVNKLRNHQFIPYGNTNYMLIEFSWTKNIYDNPTSLINEVIKAGYLPVIAHPERYQWVHEDYHLIEEWKHMGCLLQVNRTSILGLDKNPSANAYAFRLMQDDVVDLIGSDAHRCFAPRFPKLSDAYRLIEAAYGKQRCIKLMANSELLVK